MADSIYTLQQQFAAQDATKATPTVGSGISGATKYFTDIGSQTKKNDARNLVLMQARIEKNKQMVAAEQVGNAQEKQTELYMTALNQAKDAYASGHASDAVAIAKKWSKQNQGIAQVYKNVGDEQAVQKTEASKNETYLKFLANARTKSSNDIISKFQASIVGQDPTVTPEKLQSDINSKVQDFMANHIYSMSTEQKTSLLTQLNAFSKTFDAGSKQTNLNIKDQQAGTILAEKDTKNELSSLVPDSRQYYDEVKLLINTARKQNWSKTKYDAYVGHFAGVKYDIAKDNKAKINNINDYLAKITGNKQVSFPLDYKPKPLQEPTPLDRLSFKKEITSSDYGKTIKAMFDNRQDQISSQINKHRHGVATNIDEKASPFAKTMTIPASDYEKLSILYPQLANSAKPTKDKQIQVDTASIKYIYKNIDKLATDRNIEKVNTYEAEKAKKKYIDSKGYMRDISVNSIIGRPLESLQDFSQDILKQYPNLSTTDVSSAYLKYQNLFNNQKQIYNSKYMSELQTKESDPKYLKTSYNIINNPDSLSAYKKRISSLPEYTQKVKLAQINAEAKEYENANNFRKAFGTSGVTVSLNSKKDVSMLVEKGLDKLGFGNLYKSLSSNQADRDKLTKMLYREMTNPSDKNGIKMGSTISGRASTIKITNFKSFLQLSEIARKVADKWIKEHKEK